MRTYQLTLTSSELAMFHRPGIDLTTGQLLEMADARQIDLFAPLACGQRLPIGKILHACSNRAASACHHGGGEADKRRAIAYHNVAVMLDEMPSGHPLFAKLDDARAIGGEQWEKIEADFVEALGRDVEAWVTFACRLETLLDEYLLQHQ